MPNMRGKNKRMLGGFVDASLEQKATACAKKHRLDKTEMVELGMIQVMLDNQVLTQAELKEMVEQRKIKDWTIVQLHHLRLISVPEVEELEKKVKREHAARYKRQLAKEKAAKDRTAAIDPHDEVIARLRSHTGNTKQR